MEKRTYGFELRATGSDSKTVAGYAAVFNAPSLLLYGEFKEVIERGAFAGSVSRDIRALWNHNDDIVIGRTKVNTLRLAEDAHGLRVEIDMPAERRAELESIRRGDVDQMSFGFEVNLDSWQRDADGVMVRTLHQVTLHEVSPVTFPAYPQTSISMRGDALGDKPTIPAHLTQGANGDDAERAQGRLAVRRRRLALMELETNGGKDEQA